MRLLLSVFRSVLIGINLFLLNFQPNTEVEVNIFFAARMVFFLMLVIDYAQVTYYNNGVERFIGVLGTLVALFFAFIDMCGFLQILVLEKAGSGYIISGNVNNFVASTIKPFNAQIYVLISWFSVVIILGLEVVNSGVRALPVFNSEVKSTKTA